MVGDLGGFLWIARRHLQRHDIGAGLAGDLHGFRQYDRRHIFRCIAGGSAIELRILIKLQRIDDPAEHLAGGEDLRLTVDHRQDQFRRRGGGLGGIGASYLARIEIEAGFGGEFLRQQWDDTGAKHCPDRGERKNQQLPRPDRSDGGAQVEKRRVGRRHRRSRNRLRRDNNGRLDDRGGRDSDGLDDWLRRGFGFRPDLAMDFPTGVDCLLYRIGRFLSRNGFNLMDKVPRAHHWAAQAQALTLSFGRPGAAPTRKLAQSLASFQ